MSLRKLVETQVKNAFNLIGDLKDSFIFSREAKSFNKTTLENEVTTISTKPVEAVCVNRTGKKGYSAELYVPVQSITEPFLFDSVSGLGRTWKIVGPIQSDGYLYTLRLQELS